jgi:hypothetical protein
MTIELSSKKSTYVFINYLQHLVSNNVKKILCTITLPHKTRYKLSVVKLITTWFNSHKM